MAVTLNNISSTFVLLPATFLSSNYSCNLCSKLFISQNYLDKHVNSVHGNITLTLNGDSGIQNLQPVIKYDLSKSAMKKKLRVIEPKMGRVKKKSVNNLAHDFNENVKKMRSDKKNVSRKCSEIEKKYICNECNRSFMRKSYLAKHQKIHSRSRSITKLTNNQPNSSPFNETDKKLVSSSDNNSLSNSSDNKEQYSCYVCSENFSYEVDLVKHLKIHSKSLSNNDLAHHFNETVKNMLSDKKNVLRKCSEIENKYICNECNRSFKRKSYLTKHQKIHSRSHSITKLTNNQPNSSPFNETDKKLVSLSDNNLLSNSSDNKEQYSCYVCNENFCYEVDLVKHFKIHSKSLSNIDLLTCKICFESFHSKSIYDLHKKIHAEYTYKCEFCDQEFKEELFLKNHVAIHHVKAEYICKYCDYKCSEEFQYSQHLKSHLSNNKFNCILCTESFDQENLLKSHMGIHVNDKSFTCKKCARKFVYLGSLKTHICSKEPYVKKSNVCDICKKQFKGNHHLLNHYRIHTGEKPYECDKCQLKFANSSNLKRHHLTHLGKKAHQCDTCHKGFDRKHMLKEHTYLHTGEMPYKCDICSMQFNQSKLLLLHQEVHTGRKPFTCEICDQGYSSKLCLTSHLRSHLEGSRFKCEFCHISFARKRNLKQHYLTHTGEKPFMCEICEKSFSRRTALRTHKHIHSDIKPFNCDICKQGFNQKVSLRFHLKKHNKTT